MSRLRTDSHTVATAVKPAVRPHLHLLRRLRWLVMAALSATVFLCVGCATEATGDSDKKSRTTGKSKTAAAAKSAKPKADERQVPAPKNAELLPIAKGQWTRFTIKRPGSTKDFTYAVIGKEGDAHWLDVSLKGDGQNTSIQILVAIPDRKDPKQVDIRKVKVKLPTGKVQTFSGATIQMAQKQFQSFMGRFAVPDLSAASQEDVTVPAGKFLGCYKRNEKVSMFGITDESTVWNHPAVPIMAMVKLVSKDGAVYELVGYGLSGAKPSM